MLSLNRGVLLGAYGFNAVPTHHNHSLATGLIFWVRLRIHGMDMLS